MSLGLEPSSQTEWRDEAALLTATRSGDLEAYGELFERHVDAANRLGRSLTSRSDADDLVAESFLRILSTIQRGGGPQEFFRAYLLTAVRRQHVDRIRHTTRERPTEHERLDSSVDFVDVAQIGFERSATAAAFASLPERWQLVLWHIDVEGNKPADVAPLLGMTPNAVSALVYRAREGLRQAYLQSHVTPTTSLKCSSTISKLGAYVRDGLAKRDETKVNAHLDECRACAGLVLELREFNEEIAGILAPAVLGFAAIGYLNSVGSASAMSAAATAGGLSFARDGASSASASMTTGTVAGGFMASLTALAPAGIATAVVLVAGVAGLATINREVPAPPGDRNVTVASPPRVSAPSESTPPLDETPAPSPRAVEGPLAAEADGEALIDTSMSVPADEPEAILPSAQPAPPQTEPPADPGPAPAPGPAPDPAPAPGPAPDPAPEPVDPKPVVPKPVDPKPVDPKPVVPKPVDPKPVEPVDPVDPVEPVEPGPVDPGPGAESDPATGPNFCSTPRVGWNLIQRGLYFFFYEKRFPNCGLPQ